MTAQGPVAQRKSTPLLTEGLGCRDSPGPRINSTKSGAVKEKVGGSTPSRRTSLRHHRRSIRDGLLVGQRDSDSRPHRFDSCSRSPALYDGVSTSRRRATPPDRSGPEVTGTRRPGVARHRQRPTGRSRFKLPEEDKRWEWAATRRCRHRGVAQLGRASALGAEGRTFKSCHPDQPTSFVTRGRGRCAGSSAWLERFPDKEEAGGSSPPRRTQPAMRAWGSRAREVERPPEEREVAGSTPAGTTIGRTTRTTPHITLA